MRSFYHLLANTLITGVTNFTVWFALTYFVYLQTQSVLATSIISGIYTVTTALTGFWLGSFVDHYRKKPLMIISSVITLVLFLLAFGIYLMSPPEAFTTINSVTLWVFVPIVMFGVLAGNIRNIALPTLVSIIVPEDRRDKANGLVGSAFGISFLITSVISGFLVALGGMYYAFLLAIFLTLAAIVHLVFVDIKEKVVAHTEAQPKKLDIKGTLAVIGAVPGLFALILFTMFNNFLGGVFMSLMDAYGLSLVSVEIWGLLWGVLSLGFMVGGLIIAKWGLGKNPLKSMMMANLVIWTVSCLFTLQPSIILLAWVCSFT